MNEGTTNGWGDSSLLALLTLAIIVCSNDNVAAEHTVRFQENFPIPGTCGEIHLTLKCAPCGWMRRSTTISSPHPQLCSLRTTLWWLAKLIDLVSPHSIICRSSEWPLLACAYNLRYVPMKLQLLNGQTQLPSNVLLYSHCIKCLRIAKHVTFAGQPNFTFAHGTSRTWS